MSSRFLFRLLAWPLLAWAITVALNAHAKPRMLGLCDGGLFKWKSSGSVASEVKTHLLTSPEQTSSEIRQWIASHRNTPLKLKSYLLALTGTLDKEEARQKRMKIKDEYDLVILGTGPRAVALAHAFTDRLKQSSQATGLPYRKPSILLIGESELGGSFSETDFTLNSPEEFVLEGEAKPQGFTGSWLSTNPLSAPLTLGELATEKLWNEGIAPLTEKELAANANYSTAQNAAKDRRLLFASSGSVTLAIRWQAYLSGAQVATGQALSKIVPLVNESGLPSSELHFASGVKVKAGAVIRATSSTPTTDFQVDYGRSPWNATTALGSEFSNPNDKQFPTLVQVEDVYAWVKNKNLSDEQLYDLLKDKTWMFAGEGDGTNTAIEEIFKINPRQPGNIFFRLVQEKRIKILWFGQKSKDAKDFLARQLGSRSYSSRGAYRDIRYARLAGLFELPSDIFVAIPKKIHTVSFNADQKLSIYSGHAILREGVDPKKESFPIEDMTFSTFLEARGHHLIYSTGHDFREAQEQDFLWTQSPSPGLINPTPVVTPEFNVPGSAIHGKPALLASQEQYYAERGNPESLRMSNQYSLDFYGWGENREDQWKYVEGMQIGFGTLLKNPASLAKIIPPTRVFGEFLADHYLKTGSLLIYTALPEKP